MNLYPAATPRVVPYSTGGGVTSLGLVLHVQAGDNSPYGWFANPGNQAVSHWWVSKTGAVEQYVDADAKSWAQMAGNSTYHSVETEGQPTESLTSEQISALAALYRWGRDTFGWAMALAERPGQPGFGWHGMGGAAWGGHYGCPGDLRKAQRQAILDLARQGDDMPTSDEVAAAVFARMADADAAIRAGKPLTADQVQTIQGVDLIAHRVAAVETAAVNAAKAATPKGTPA